jgi:hypothetical protein
MNINYLGEDLSVRLLRQNNFSNETTRQTLVPAIQGMNVFRVLANHVAEIYCDFAYNNGILNEDGTVEESKFILTGMDDVWYRCSNNSIFNPIIYMINPDPAGATFDSLDLIFQFASQVPPEYVFTD